MLQELFEINKVYITSNKILPEVFKKHLPLLEFDGYYTRKDARKDTFFKLPWRSILFGEDACIFKLRMPNSIPFIVYFRLYRRQRRHIEFYMPQTDKKIVFKARSDEELFKALQNYQQRIYQFAYRGI
jgi:hypothetical protein|nr:MAG TPA: hypothetical protein [Caudoviricetes sp.]